MARLSGRFNERIATGLGIRSGGGAAMAGTRAVIDFMFVDFLNDAFGEIVKRVQR